MVLSSRASIRSSRSRKSEFEYGSEFGDDDYSVDDDESTGADFDDLGRRPSGISQTSSVSADSYLESATRAMSKLQDLHSMPDSSWKKALTQKKTGCVVYITKEKSYVSQGRSEKKGFYAPVFKGVLDISGFAPTAVFAVMGTRKLWDDWYKEGSLVENLSDDSSLTYMCMKGIAGSSTRDLSLVEKVQGSPTGTICFATTSVVTPKVPRVAGRVRASIALNGWVLEPIEDGTRISYYLHVNVRTFMPSFAATKYLARRPTVIARIADYLSTHGAPPMVPYDPEPTAYSGSNGGQGGELNGMAVAGSGGGGRRRRDSVSSKRSSRSTGTAASGGAVGLPAHVELVKDGASYEAVQTALKLFKATLSQGSGGGWRTAKDPDGTRIWMKAKEGARGETELPIVKGEAEVENVTTEQVLGTILNESARRIWDPRIDSLQPSGLDNGFDQGVVLEANKGIFPSVKPFHYIVGTGVEREDPADQHGQILSVSRSVDADVKKPKGSQLGQVDFSGYLLDPAAPHAVKVTRIAQLDVAGAKLNPATYKVLSIELALGPRRLGEFIDEYGFAPSFLRWGSGPAELIGTSKPGDDIVNGKVTFSIGGEGKGTMSDGKQVCWLQWSSKMYPRGIDVTLDPPDVAEVAKVETPDGQVMLELAWTEKVKQGALLKLSQSLDGEGTEDVYVGGEFLDKTITASGGPAPKRKANAPPPQPQRRASSSDNVAEAAGAGVAGAAAGAGLAAAGRRGSQNKDGARSPPPVDSSPPPFLGKTKGAGADAEGRNATATSYASEGGASATASSGGIPANAMLIINKDLYFTQQQVIVMVAFVAAAYVWGKMA
ncbi:START-like domain protein [Rhodotorula toruloides]|uniref:BY PROTMAP: gi/472585224/gb/EMS22790.1/ START-like domain protein [Rhodosporidium toruloides NP11] gi/647400007/emb/CDR45070.1/ RHTO0S10e04786g1_1 [Rhodosporidium toruloides] n=1 Tax=Rhodotorula toruloides TaxID=5286 RepID=A0A0K3CJS5_RHOTO|nr:START-like domain protein [Rhodotorula toruloides]PRQ74360.1 hypothetical protein AAT19DRAFT_14713 [Rhodotorula toruloides]